MPPYLEYGAAYGDEYALPYVPTPPNGEAPTRLYAAAFWFTDAVREAGRSGMAGVAADVVEFEAGAVVEPPVGASVAVGADVPPARSQGFGGDAIGTSGRGYCLEHNTINIG